MKNTIRIVLSAAIIFLWSICYAQDIHEAAESGDLEQLKRLVQSNPELVGVRSTGGSAPLHFAATNAHTDAVRFLIESGANVNETNESGYTPLHYAAAYDRVDNVELLIERGAVIEAKSLEGETSLHVAVLSEAINSIKKLLFLGANIEAMEDRNRTPLLLAARESGNPDLASLLLEKGANINAADKYGSNALELAAWRGFSSLVDTLLQAGIRLPESKERGEKMLEYAVRKNLLRLFYALTDNIIDLGTLSTEQPELINLAASGGAIKIVDELLKNGLKLNYADKDGWTPLHHAAEYNRTRMMDFLLSKDVRINARTHIGQSAYNIAVEEDSQEAAGLLLKYGCDTTSPRFPTINGMYFGQSLPGETPEIFAPEITSAHFKKHSSISFSPDKQMAAWSVMVPPRTEGYSKGRILLTRKNGSSWSYPSPPGFEGRDVPVFSPDGTRLYFISRKPGYEGGPAKEYIWYVEPSGHGWTTPLPLNKEVNAYPLHWQFSVDNKHTLYFGTGDGRIMESKYKNGAHQKPVNLAEVYSNPSISGGSPFINPTGDYLIFSKENDLFIAFRKTADTWSEAIRFDESINSTSNETCPIVSPDGRYLFFNRDWDIYWVLIEDRIRSMQSQITKKRNNNHP